MELENIGSMITIKGTNNCLGYLMHFEGRGTYDAEYGKVDVSKADADTHNRLLDDAMLKGMDENCQVGQHGTFYTGQHEGRDAIKTFLGTLVSADIVSKKRHGMTRQHNLTFRRAGKVYRGRTSAEHDLFNFKRIS